MFTLGGLSGVLHSIVPADTQQTDTYFVVAHFHYVLFGGLFLGIFSGFYYWWPKVFGRMLDETLGKWNFWVMLVGFNLTFFPMHILGLIGMPRRTYRYPEGMGWDAMNMIETVGAFVIMVSVLIFFVNIIYSTQARAASLPPTRGTAARSSGRSRRRRPTYNFAEIPRGRGPRRLVAPQVHRGRRRPAREAAVGRLRRRRRTRPSGDRRPRAHRRPTWRSPMPAAVAAPPSSTTTATGTASTCRRRRTTRSCSPPACRASGYAAVFLRSSGSIPGLILLLFGMFAWGLEPGTSSG